MRSSLRKLGVLTLRLGIWFRAADCNLTGFSPVFLCEYGWKSDKLETTMLMTVYLACAVVGGLLILMSLFGGDHGADHADVSFDHDADLSADAGHEAAASHEGAWLPFLSLRFWSYGLAGFGAIGMILQLMGRVPAAIIPWIAAGFGLSLGISVAWTLRQLSRNSLNSGAGVDDLLGQEAEVTVPIRGSDAGRVRATIKGDIIDLLAVSDEPAALMPGSPVYIVSVEGDRVKVMSRSTLLEEGETITVGTQ